MAMIWKRLHDSGKNWRHVYKVSDLIRLLWLRPFFVGARVRASLYTENVRGKSTLPLPSSAPPLTHTLSLYAVCADAQSLLLLEFLLKTASEGVVAEIKGNLFSIQVLQGNKQCIFLDMRE